MRVMPEVSVLMGVYNAGATLEATLDSILDQEGIELEFIVVDDGSTDGSGDLLDRRAARDPRLIVIHQANAGLTVSLQRAATRARGRFLARQDASGDRSLPGRLAAQARLLGAREDAVFVTCGHRYVEGDGGVLFEGCPTEAEVAAGLSTLRMPGVRGIMHASAMIDAAVFRQVGGYRAAFEVAQDIDLWLHLHEIGNCAVVPDVLYECVFELEGISGRRRGLQLAFADLAVRCAIARRAGQPEPPLERPVVEATGSRSSIRKQRADFHYFVASCLRRTKPRRARRHYLQAWLAQPSYIHALLRAALTW